MKNRAELSAGASEVDRLAQELIDNSGPDATMSAAYRSVALDWHRRYQELLKAFQKLVEKYS